MEDFKNQIELMINEIQVPKKLIKILPNDDGKIVIELTFLLNIITKQFNELSDYFRANTKTPYENDINLIGIRINKKRQEILSFQKRQNKEFRLTEFDRIYRESIKSPAAMNKEFKNGINGIDTEEEKIKSWVKERVSIIGVSEETKEAIMNKIVKGL